ncbi:MAG: nucleotidyltransferase family protein [Rhodocyclaceae bacterium]|nr:nucleotidyltransferase family protein [Rhodocyclaceae bacterium]
MGCPLKQGGGLYVRLSIGAVILAAGEASRLGGRPKPLLALGGVPLIRRLLVALSAAGVDAVVVVTGGPHGGAIEAAVADFPLQLLRNPSPGDGQVSSVRLGLAALPAHCDAMLMCLADQPLINGDDLVALIRAYKQRGEARAVVPRVDGARGNPVLLDFALRDQVLAGGERFGCRQWIDAHPEAVSYFDSGNRHYLEDVDTPDDLSAFEQRYGHALAWPPQSETT